MSESPIIFRKPQRYPYNLTENQLREAVTLYEAHAIMKIMLAVQLDHPLELYEDDSLVDLFKTFIQKGITEGMNMSVNHMDVIHFYLDHLKEQEKYKAQITDYVFEEGKGVCGILSPDGFFTKCGNAEHYIIYGEIDDADKPYCLFFSSALDGSDSGVVSFSTIGNAEKAITNAQMDWIDEHLDFFDGSQKDFIKMYKETEK